MKLQSYVFAALVAGASLPAMAAGPTAFDRWEQRLRQRVGTLHHYPVAAPKGATGDVLVSFRIGSDGRPADPAILASSGYGIFDTAAVRLVAQLGRLGSIPATATALDRVTIKLSYGEPERLADRRRVAQADAEERASNDRRNRLIVSHSARLADRRR